MNMGRLYRCWALVSMGLAACACAGHAPAPPATTSGTVKAAAAPEADEKAAAAVMAADRVPQSVDFEARILPILEARCRPCHFEGGTVYARMPFDQPATIRTLGTKLFTRIQDPREQILIRSFLDQFQETGRGETPASPNAAGGGS